VIRIPGDKSISHRALLFAAIANGRSTLTHLATGEDVGATHTALTQLGVKIRTGTTGTVVFGGGFGGLTEPGDVLDCGNSGTTMRLFSGVLAGSNVYAVLNGDASLRRRPMARIVEPLNVTTSDVDEALRILKELFAAAG
jgi:3-phosphoshikimate 1-carboxyvinyltransferase